MPQYDEMVQDARRICEACQMIAEPWTVERMRRMTRQQFAECVKRGDLPPTDVAVAFMQERLELRRTGVPPSSEKG
jgi:hypothetical protein